MRGGILAGLLVLLVCLATVTAAPAAEMEARKHFGPQDAPAMVLRSTTDIAVLGPAIADFVTRNPGIAVDFQQWGSNALYAQSLADCAAGKPGADAILSSAVHQVVALVNRACAQPYRSALTAALPEARRWRDEVWGVTLEPAVIIYNTHLVPPADIPRSRFALLDLMRREDHRYDGKIATYDIEASGLGYLFAFEDSLEASTFGSLIEGFARSHSVATCCSAEIIKGVSEGRYLIAYNVLGSYVNVRRDPGVGVVRPSDYTLMLSRGYMIPRAAAHAGPARRLLDFLLSHEGRGDLAKAGLIAADPGDEDAPAESVLRPIAITPVLLVALDRQKRAQFIRRWRDAFGQGKR